MYSEIHDILPALNSPRKRSKSFFASSPPIALWKSGLLPFNTENLFIYNQNKEGCLVSMVVVVFIPRNPSQMIIGRRTTFQNLKLFFLPEYKVNCDATNNSKSSSFTFFFQCLSPSSNNLMLRSFFAHHFISFSLKGFYKNVLRVSHWLTNQMKRPSRTQPVSVLCIPARTHSPRPIWPTISSSTLTAALVTF